MFNKTAVNIATITTAAALAISFSSVASAFYEPNGNCRERQRLAELTDACFKGVYSGQGLFADAKERVFSCAGAAVAWVTKSF